MGDILAPPEVLFKANGDVLLPVGWVGKPPALGLVVAPSAPSLPVGFASPVGWIEDPHERPPVATFCLEIGKVELPGLYVCVGRRFLPAVDWGRGE